MLPVLIILLWQCWSDVVADTCFRAIVGFVGPGSLVINSNNTENMPDPDFLTKLDLFADLEPEALTVICRVTRLIRLHRDERIFSQGELAKCAYALLEGGVRIVQTGADGGQSINRFIAPGEIFGVVPLFTDHRYPADAIALGPSLILCWHEQDLLILVERFPRIAINMIRIIGARLNLAQHRTHELATQRAGQRIAHTLLRLCEQMGSQVDNVTTAIDIPLRRKDLAEISGTTLHTASRTLSAWEKAGYLLSCEQRLLICNRTAIENIANEVSD
ncbi:MAG: Crp/Fnr family transcriptional regulator [Parahaliea sp.]